MCVFHFDINVSPKLHFSVNMSFHSFDCAVLGFCFSFHCFLPPPVSVGAFIIEREHKMLQLPF